MADRLVSVDENYVFRPPLENRIQAKIDAGDWLKDILMVAGDSFDNYIGISAGKQVKGKIPTSTVAAGIAGWPAGLSHQGARFVSHGLTSSVSLQSLQTYSVTDPQLWVRSAAGTGGQAWKRIGDPADPAGSLTVNLLAAGQDVHLLDSGNATKKQWSLASVPTNWQTQHLPVNERGTVEQTPIGSSRLMTYLTWEPSPRLFACYKYNGAWSAWREIGATQPPAQVELKPASGMKRVGVPITAGHSGSDAPLEATVRMPLLYQAPIFRWRLRIHDINPRSGVTRAGQINISAIWLGTHTGAGAMSNPVQLSGALTIPDGATEYRTPWFNTPIVAATEHLLSFGYTKATAPWNMLGYSYQTVDDANAGDTNPAGMTKLGTAPFSIAIEAETYSTTPVVACIGDSNSVGVGATNGLHDSWLSQLCRRIKALPDHRGSSGDTMTASQDGTAYKWTRFADLTKPDAVLFALGQNDAAVTNQTDATMESLLATNAPNCAKISNTTYYVNLMPRTTDPWAGFEEIKRQHNARLLGLPHGALDVYDIGAAISTDDETILPEYDADGTHLNTAGFGAVQASFTRPVTSPPVQYAVI